MQAIYVYTGGAWLRETINAIVVFMGTDSWTIIFRIAAALAVLAVAVSWVRRHDIMDMVGWAAVLTLMSMLVNVRAPVQIIDSSDLTRTYQVDNVPVGIVIPASMITSIGHALVMGYEAVFTVPDSVTYSKTGMLFGASLVSRSTDFLSRNPEITGMFSDYVQNCVIGDIFLNNKYSMEELMNSPDPYTLIFAKPSPLRGIFNRNNKFMTCEEVAAEIKPKLALDSQTGGKTWSYYVRRMFGGRPSPDLLFSQMVGDSYSYFYGAGQSAGQIMRQNVTMNALKGGILGYAARNGDTASLLNIATTSSMEKQRLAHATIGQTVLRSLQMTQTLSTGIIIGIFPLMILGGLFSAVTLSMLKGYIFGILWLQTWPLLYAILNSCMNFYAKVNGAPVVLSELFQVQLQYSDLATTAGYLSVLIPPLAWAMLKGLGAGLSSAYTHLASSAISPASSAAAGSVDGNYSYANMQTENVSGYNWNTNSSTSFGQMSSQLGNGATQTRTRDGGTVWDSSGGTSKLPVEINVSRQIASAQQQMARESESQAQTALQGFNSSVSSSWSTLQQFTGQSGNSSTMTAGSDTSQGYQNNMMASRMRSAVESYAKANNISNEQATSELAQQSTEKSVSLNGKFGMSGSKGIKVFGTGATVEGYVGVSGSVRGADSDSHSASSGTRQGVDARHDVSAQAARDFKEGMDYFTSRKLSSSGSHSENNADSRVDQLSASLSSAKSSYSQYSNASTRSHEYAEMASRTETLSGQMGQNLTQQFAAYVARRSPDNAQEILTDSTSPAVAAQRAALAREFVNEQVAPEINAGYEADRASLGAGMNNVAGAGGDRSVYSDYDSNREKIEKRSADAGIENNVGDKVDREMRAGQSGIDNTASHISGKEAEISLGQQALRKNHEEKQAEQNHKYTEEKEKQSLLPGADSKEEMMEKAKEFMNKFDK